MEFNGIFAAAAVSDYKCLFRASFALLLQILLGGESMSLIRLSWLTSLLPMDTIVVAWETILYMPSAGG